MECKDTNDSILVYETVFDSTAEQPVDVDFTLPDYCPDIGKILKCRAKPVVTAKECSGETIKIEGMTYLEVVYQEGRDKNVRCCRYEQPFSMTVPTGGCGDGAKAAVQPRVDYINCRATSQRKVDIHGAFTVHIRIAVPKRYELLTQAEGAGVKTRMQSAAIAQYAGRAQNSFVVSEALELAQGKPPISSIVRSGADINVLECKPIANKLIVKGEAVLEVVYCTDMSGRLEAMEYVIPFNQFLDLPGLDDTCVLDTAIETGAVNISLRTDSDGEYRRLSADIHATTDIKAYRMLEMSVIRDAYSTECELNVERRYVGMERFAAQTGGRCVCGGVLETTREIAEVLDAWCEVTSASGESSGKSVALKGNVLVCAIARLDDGDCEYIEKTYPFESDVSLPTECENARVSVRAGVKGCTCTLSGTSKIDMRAELDCAVSVYEQEQLGCVTSIKPDETRRKEADKSPAVVMYYADSGEDLWSIAREHNASVEDIMSDNGLTEEVLEENRLLLISVR